MKGNITIIAAGPVECGLCPSKTGDDGGIVKKEGAAIDVDGTEMHLCWRHVQAFAKMKASARLKDSQPAFPAMASNGQD